MMKVIFATVTATTLLVASSTSDAFITNPAFSRAPQHHRYAMSSLGAVVAPVVVAEAVPSMVTTQRSGECAQTMGECSIDELVALEQELELLNDECFIELTESDLCDADMQAGRNVLQKTLALQHELHQLEQQLKGMPFVIDTKVDQEETTKEADDHWIAHYIESYHW